jgi:hypothetical protein
LSRDDEFLLKKHPVDLKELITLTAGAMTAEAMVQDFINANFLPGAVVVKDFPLFPAGKRLTDHNGDEMTVYYDYLTDRVNYIYPNEGGVKDGEKTGKRRGKYYKKI